MNFNIIYIFIPKKHKTCEIVPNEYCLFVIIFITFNLWGEIAGKNGRK
jgi:hypothetical protein